MPDPDPPASELRITALITAASIADALGDVVAARTQHEAALALARQVEDRRAEGISLSALANYAQQDGDEALALAHSQASTAIHRSLNDPWLSATAAFNQGTFRWIRGDLDLAERFLKEALHGFSEQQNPWAEGVSSAYLGDLEFRRSNFAASSIHFRAALGHFGRNGSDWTVGWVLSGIGALTIATGNPDIGVRLLAAAESGAALRGNAIGELEKERNRTLLAQAKETLGPVVFDSAWNDGLILAQLQAIEVAHHILDEIDADARDSLDPPILAPAARLTRREHQVLALIAAGRTNREIAETLYVSHRTATTHVTNILAKLGVTSRTEATALALKQNLI